MDGRRHLRERRSHAERFVRQCRPEAKLQPRENRLKQPAIAAVVSSVTLLAWLIVQPHVPAFINLILVLTSVGAFVYGYRRRHRLPEKQIVALVVFSLCVAIALPPRGSHDVYSYAMYGRMVAHYHESPYTHHPNEHPGDPLLAHVASGWQHVPSAYGPVFTGISAGVSEIGGSSPTFNRLLYQLLAGSTVLVVCVALSRRFTDSRPWLLLGLNPATLAIVNGGHNDLLTGTLVLLGAVLAQQKRIGWAGTALAAAICVKLSALVPAIAVLLVLICINKRYALRFVVPCAGLSIVGYALAGGTDTLNAITSDSNTTSRASFVGLAHHWLNSTSLSVVSAIVFVWICWWWILRRKQTNPIRVSTFSSTALIYASPYVLPWYSGWVLPSAAIAEGTLFSEAALFQSGALLIAYSAPAGTHAGPIVGAVSVVALPIALVRTFFGSRLSD